MQGPLITPYQYKIYIKKVYPKVFNGNITSDKIKTYTHADMLVHAHKSGPCDFKTLPFKDSMHLRPSISYTTH